MLKEHQTADEPRAQQEAGVKETDVLHRAGQGAAGDVIPLEDPVASIRSDCCAVEF